MNAVIKLLVFLLFLGLIVMFGWLLVNSETSQSDNLVNVEGVNDVHMESLSPDEGFSCIDLSPEASTEANALVYKYFHGTRGNMMRFMFAFQIYVPHIYKDGYVYAPGGCSEYSEEYERGDEKCSCDWIRNKVTPLNVIKRREQLRLSHDHIKTNLERDVTICRDEPLPEEAFETTGKICDAEGEDKELLDSTFWMSY